MARTLEAHRIFLNFPESKIIISGSDVASQVMKKFLVLWGVPSEQVIIDYAGDTWVTAVNVKKRIGNQPFIVVTSSIHLPRTMKSFNEQKLNPVPAPADYFYGYYEKYDIPFGKPLKYFVPNIDSFWRSNLAIYEYRGMFTLLKEWCKKQIMWIN